MNTYIVSYRYKTPGSNTSYDTSEHVKAETEATAIRIIEGKHSGKEVTIRSIKKC